MRLQSVSKQQLLLIAVTLTLLASAIILASEVNARGAQQRALHVEQRGAACNYACAITAPREKPMWFQPQSVVLTSETDDHDQ